LVRSRRGLQKNLSYGFSRLQTALAINLLGTEDGRRCMQSCRERGGRKDIQGMIWPVSMEISASVVYVSSFSGQGVS